MNSLPMILRLRSGISHALQFRQEALRSVHVFELDVEILAEDALNSLGSL